MIFREMGEVVPGLHALGSAHTPSYLIDGDRPLLIDSGMSYLGPRYVEHARRVLGGRSPWMVAHTHAHFDHCGSTAQLVEAFPGLRVASSALGAEIVTRPRALETIRALNDNGRSHFSPASPAVEFRPFTVDTVLAEGDELSVGEGTTVRVLATPGHTRDFLSYYVPERKLLVASEAVGCLHTSGRVMVEFGADYDAYLASLRRLSGLDVEVLCQGHEVVFVGEDCAAHMARSIEATQRYGEWVDRLLGEESGDVAAVVARVKELEWEPLPAPKQPESAYLLNTEARVRNLAARRNLPKK
ncbi:MAG: MBL fold metallo-hydrolase [Deltaproteobacteria bacterium]|nr:MBL fold metallo-hydrolase [Deltaproteobacteria bacterium]